MVTAAMALPKRANPVPPPHLVPIRPPALQRRASCLNHQRKKGRIMTIRPLHDRVLIKRITEEEKTKGGIIIPDTAKEKPMEGEIVAVGQGKILEDGKVRPLEVKKGDRVLFAKYAGTEVKINGEEHLILSEDEILGIVQ